MNDLLLYLVVSTAIGSLLLSWLTSRPNLSKFPVLNPLQRNRWGFKVQADKNGFLSNARELLREGFARFGKPFVLNTENGPRIVLPNSMVELIKNDPRLSFDEAVANDFFAHYPGFDAIKAGHNNNFVPDMVRTKLTQNLAVMTQALADEAAEVLDKRWGQDPEWHSIDLADDVLYLVAHLSARVFLGPELSHNEEWLRLSIDYTLVIFNAARVLRLWPAPLRRIAVWFIPECVRLRQKTKRAREIVGEIIAKREAARKQPDYVRVNDSIEWFHETAKGQKFDMVGMQLGLTMAAIHTTTDLTKQCLIDLAERPQLVEELRKEISEVLPNGNTWQKTDMPRMKLLDSTIKETQRLKPVGIVSMQRAVVDNLPLPDGTVLPKGALCITSAQNLWEEKIHEKPDVYDGARFYRQRQEKGKENVGQLVSLSADHLAFGYGKHACPGRFFAGNEVKISLAYILSNFDMKLVEADKATPFPYGFELIVNPMAKLAVRRRTASAI